MARITFKLEDGTELETELKSDVVTVGRHPGSDAVLPSASVSAHHATIKRRGDAYYVQDLGTTNGTKLNGVDVEEAKLEDGDRLSFGDVPATVQLTGVSSRKKAVAPAPAPAPVSAAAAAPAAAPASAPNPARNAPAPKARVPGKKGPGRGPMRRFSQTTYSESSGCAGFIAVLIFLSLAFVAGLFARHYVTYHRFLLTDLAERLRERYLGPESEAPAGRGGSDAGDPKSR